MSYKTVTEIKVFETPWTGLPEELTRCFTPHERQAYLGGAVFFKDCAHRSGEPVLIEMLAELNDDQPMRVYVERTGSNLPDVWFGFTYLRRDRQPQFKLADEGPIPSTVPQRLESLFKVYSGIREGEQDEGGFRTPRLMTHQELMPFNDSLLSLNSKRYTQFFSFGNGDVVACNDYGTAVLFDHETHDVFTKDMDEFLNDYFVDLSKTYEVALKEHRGQKTNRA